MFQLNLHIQEQTHIHQTLTKTTPLTLALCIHAILDGLLLNLSPTTHPLHTHCHHSLLAGILLHKIPIAITLTTMLKNLTQKKIVIFAQLLLFALATPLGIILGQTIQDYNPLTSKTLLFIRAIATGSLLDVATTILFESNPQHHFNHKKLLTIITAGLIATATTLL